MINDTWKLNQQNGIVFIMRDSAGLEVPGLGATFTLEIAKWNAGFVASAGTKSEISNGFYRYLTTTGESDTVGATAVRVTGAGCIQNNLEYVVEQRTPGATPFAYTFTDSGTGIPGAGAQVWITTDLAGLNTIWVGVTHVFGVPRDLYGNLPYLPSGTYYIWVTKAGVTTDSYPDIEVQP